MSRTNQIARISHLVNWITRMSQICNLKNRFGRPAVQENQEIVQEIANCRESQIANCKKLQMSSGTTQIAENQFGRPAVQECATQNLANLANLRNHKKNNQKSSIPSSPVSRAERKITRSQNQ
ncbi:hypothetical protein ZOSMA_169G00100 [Zostera marina]|uniref:Uncharacterized protein n=1 Tax=Zostera marina TaxID=29655 RepID=A0A0K9PVH2_ZOSMR|nr:hypothetical protein ZOSMA_169G00100 [Zostera marina]